VNKFEVTNWIKRRARELGFSRVGIAKAEELTEEGARLKEWLNRGYHGEMSYMGNHFEKRIDPRKLVEGTKSIVVLAYNYFKPSPTNTDTYKISKYAYGKDYHFVLKDKMRTLFQEINDHVTPVNGRVFTDSAPVMESEWAQRAGVGWQGKNTLIIHPKEGSYFFLGELMLDIELVYDDPIRDYCGTCTRCIDACPTDAIDKDGYLLDGSKCISYATIEKRGPLPEYFKGKMEDWIFGCDICQEVCPWNRFSTPHEEPEFEPHPDLLNLSKEEWKNLSRESFQEIFRKSPVKRTKYEGLKRNIDFVEKTPDSTT